MRLKRTRSHCSTNSNGAVDPPLTIRSHYKKSFLLVFLGVSLVLRLHVPKELLMPQVAFLVHGGDRQQEDDGKNDESDQENEEEEGSCRRRLRNQMEATNTASPTFASGLLTDILARHGAGSFSWNQRSDGSSQLELNACILKRFTAAQAKQCLADHHLLFVGDSLTRFQVTSLVHLLQRGTYPPRFNKQILEQRKLDGANQPPVFQCPYGHQYRQDHNLTQNTTVPCSPNHEPNVCVEDDYKLQPMPDMWESFHYQVGGATDGGVYQGHFQCDCVRGPKVKSFLAVENYFYASNPVNTTTTTTTISKTPTRNDNRVLVSYIFEAGWNSNPRPIRGASYFGDCAYHGTCRYDEQQRSLEFQNSNRENYAWIHPLAAVLETNRTTQQRPLDTILPAPVDIAIYNRGLWGALTPAQASRLMPLFYNVTHPTKQHDTLSSRHTRKQHCFFKSTTASPRTNEQKKHAEQTALHTIATDANCGFMDLAELTSPWRALQKGEPEVKRIYADDRMHFRPWVYEEFNNLFLNALCI